MGAQEVARRESNEPYRQLKLKIWHSGCWTLDVTDANPGSHIIEKSLHASDDRIIADLILRSDSGEVAASSTTGSSVERAEVIRGAFGEDPPRYSLTR